MAEAPLITILIPTLDRAALLARTLASALAQTYGAVEIVVSDNASSDETPRLLGSLADSRIRSVRQPTRLGMVEHWNACLAQASGELSVLLSDDDLLVPHALAFLQKSLAHHRSVFAYSPFVVIDEGDRPISKSRAGPEVEPGPSFLRAHLLRRRAVMPSGMLCRTTALRAVGGFPRTGTTSDLAVRLALAAGGPVSCVPEHLLHYRQHSTNLSGKLAAVVGSHLDLYQWSLEQPLLAPHRPLIRRYVRATCLPCGVRGGLAGDEPAFRAVLDRLAELELGVVAGGLARALLTQSRSPFARGLYQLYRRLRR